MTDVVEDKPFYEQARVRRAPQAPASRLPLYLLTAGAFIAGVIAFFATGKPEGGIGTGPQALGYLIGYKGGGVVIWGAIIGGAICLILSTTQARKTGQRRAVQDFLWPLLSAIAGGWAAFALVLAIVVPLMSADDAARPVMQAHAAAMTRLAQDFDRDAAAVSNGQTILSPGNLSTDPGYRRTTAMIGRLKTVVADHKQRHAAQIADGRRQLAAAIKNPGQRRRLLGEFDAATAREAPLLVRYWTLQEKSITYLTEFVGVLKSSPSAWRDGNIYFNRPGDLARLRAAQAQGERSLRELESIQQQLRAAPPARQK